MMTSDDRIADLERQVAELKVELAEMEQLYGSEFNLNNNLIAVRTALTKENERLQTIDLDLQMAVQKLAAVVRQRDELQAKWDHYQQFCQDHGAHGIGDLVVQRDGLLAAAKVALEAMESTGMFPASQYKLQAAITKVKP